MRLRLPYRILQALLAIAAPAWAQSVSVSSWSDFKAQWNAGARDFVFTQTIETPSHTSSSPDPNMDFNIPVTSALSVSTGVSLTIRGNGNVFGSKNHEHGSHSFAITRPIANLGVLNVSDCIFQNNFVSATKYMKGGAICGGGGSTASFADCSFIGNHLTGEGVSIRTGGGGAYFNGLEDQGPIPYAAKSVFSHCSFSANFINIKRTATDTLFTNAEGGALYNSSNAIVEISNGSQFNHNETIASSYANSQARGGGIFNDGTLIVSDTKFEGNLVRTETEAMVVVEKAHGGAIYHSSTNYMTLTRCSFSDNSVEGAGTNSGGAIATSRYAGDVSLVDCSFLNNTVAAGLTSGGGAIDHSAITGLFNMVAQTMTVVFRGNKVDYDAVSGSGRANAITFSGGTGADTVFDYDLRATGTINALSGEAASILFYDPVEFKQASPTNFNINRPSGATEYRGSVVFSGEDFINGNQADRISTANDKTRLVQHDGILEIRDGAKNG